MLSGRCAKVLLVQLSRTWTLADADRHLVYLTAVLPYALALLQCSGLEWLTLSPLEPK